MKKHKFGKHLTLKPSTEGIPKKRQTSLLYPMKVKLGNKKTFIINFSFLLLLPAFGHIMFYQISNMLLSFPNTTELKYRKLVNLKYFVHT